MDPNCRNVAGNVDPRALESTLHSIEARAASPPSDWLGSQSKAAHIAQISARRAAPHDEIFAYIRRARAHTRTHTFLDEHYGHRWFAAVKGDGEAVTVEPAGHDVEPGARWSMALANPCLIAPVLFPERTWARVLVSTQLSAAGTYVVSPGYEASGWSTRGARSPEEDETPLSFSLATHYFAGDVTPPERRTDITAEGGEVAC
ncbi:hypothetical protein EW146_g9015 [Bondarzewia mesenterica]|uniref:Uncharacterized protein n=1 Tax=Bondarzewia mesenterica TaxID=1095465 RepID=A0A4S4LBM1_9AGAM|nr:hypothetical protein EW146_g9015 [Bondarzewia mesenterica]